VNANHAMKCENHSKHWWSWKNDLSYLSMFYIRYRRLLAYLAWMSLLWMGSDWM